MEITLSEDEQELISIFGKLSERDRQRIIGRAEQLAEMQQPAPHKPRIRFYVADIAAGAGISSPFTIDNAFSLREFPIDAVPHNADCGVPIAGKSMEPEYPDGCIVWVSRSAKIKYGDTVIAVYNGSPYCKIYQKDGLYSYNEDFDPIIVSEGDSVSLFGKVVGYYEE